MESNFVNFKYEHLFKIEFLSETGLVCSFGAQMGPINEIKNAKNLVTLPL